MRIKGVHLAVQEALPEDMRGEVGSLDAKGLGRLFYKLAVRYPDRYSDVLDKVASLGRHAAYYQGETLRLSDFRDPLPTAQYLKEMDAEVAAAQKNEKDPAKRRQIQEMIWGKWASRLERESMDVAMAQQNNVAMSVKSGARGKPLQLRAMLTTPAMFEDSQGRQIPIFARRSYGQGISLAEFLAGTYGARTSVTATKKGTAKGGYMGKLMAQVAAPMVITEEDCGTTNGIDLDPDDDDLKNRYLAGEQADLPAGSLLERKQVARLQNSKLKRVIVRSPLTCQAGRGVCAKCVGADPTGKPFPIGTAAGITAANAISEPLTQMALNTKHLSGASTQKQTYSGLDWLTRFLQIPEDFPDKAAVADRSGTVEIEKAPQGGHFLRLGGDEHYVPAHLELKVKQHQEVEAGDILSEGVGKPDDVVRAAGLGAGRRYWADRFGQMLADSNTPAKRRDTELLARAAVNHARVISAKDIDLDGVVDDDMVPFDDVLRDYTPPENARQVQLGEAHGKFLEAPALHFTIGTAVTPGVTRRLREAGIRDVYVSDRKPAWQPEMPKLMTAAHASQDWMASMNTSHLRSQLATAATRGQDTDFEQNINYAPRLAVGVGFGENLAKTGLY